MIDRLPRHQIVQGHFHQHDRRVGRSTEVFLELPQGGIEHV